MKAAGVSFRTMLFSMIAAVVVPLAAILPFAIQRAFESQSELAREGARHLASTAAVGIDQAFADMRRSFEIRTAPGRGTEVRALSRLAEASP